MPTPHNKGPRAPPACVREGKVRDKNSNSRMHYLKIIVPPSGAWIIHEARETCALPTRAYIFLHWRLNERDRGNRGVDGGGEKFTSRLFNYRVSWRRRLLLLLRRLGSRKWNWSTCNWVSACGDKARPLVQIKGFPIHSCLNSEPPLRTLAGDSCLNEKYSAWSSAQLSSTERARVSIYLYCAVGDFQTFLF